MNYIQNFPIKFTILSISFQILSLSDAIASDYSKWSYYDLSQTAVEMAADKNYKGALKFFDLAVHASPNNPEGYVNRGGILELLNESDKAIQDEQKAIILAKNKSGRDLQLCSLAHRNLAGIYLHHNQLADAEKEAKIALKLCSDDPSAQEQLGDVFAKQGQVSEAIIYFRKAQSMYRNQKLPNESAKITNKILQLQSKQH